MTTPPALEDVAALRQRIAELEEALRPFAAEVVEWDQQEATRDDYYPLIMHDQDHSPDRALFSLGDLRRAAMLLRGPHNA